MKIQKKNLGGGGGGGWGGQGGCDRRIEVFGKIEKKKIFFGGDRGQVGGRLVGGGVRVDVNEELTFFVKIQKKNWGGGWGVR